jgi:transcriptional regulator with XRE-family HTH domain
MNLDDKQFLEAVGQRLRELRKAQGLTLIQLAKKTDLDRTFLGSVENGKRNISLLKLRLVARNLRIRVRDIVGELK